MQGAWIEMLRPRTMLLAFCRRSPCRERGLKYAYCQHLVTILASLPVQGAWIEIGMCSAGDDFKLVAPRAGSVD